MDRTPTTSNSNSEQEPLLSPARNYNVYRNNQINTPPIDPPPLRSEYPEYRYVQSDEAGIDGAIVLMLTISFLSSVSFSVSLPSLWPYVGDLGGELGDLGWAIALHSGGTILFSPILVLWARRRSLREVLVGSLIVMAAGGVLYGMAQNIVMLLISRFVIGAGSANYVITAVYLAQVSRRTRERALYLNSVTSIVGFILGPAVAAAFTLLTFNAEPFSLDKATAPGFFIAILSIIAAVFTTCASLRFLRKRARRRHPRPESYDPASSYPIYNNSATYDIAGSLLNYGIANSGYYHTEAGSVDEIPAMLRELWANRTKLPLTQLILCLFVYFSITLSFTVWETLGPALTSKQLDWGVLDNGLLFVGMGVTSGITLFLIKGLTKLAAGRLVLPAMATLMVSGAIILCAVTSHWTIPFFIAAITLISMGYTGSVSMVIHVYGRVLELSSEVPAPPSAVGWLSACGSVARLLGPVVAAYILVASDQKPLYLMIYAAGVPSVVVICVVLLYSRLPP